MADNVNITPGSGNIVAADEVTDGTLGTVKVQYVKIMDGTIDGTLKAAVTSNGLKVDGSGSTQPISGSVTVVQPTGTNLHVVVDTAPTTAVTGTFFQATQPVSGTVTTTPPANASTNLTQVGGSAITEGQKVMASSLPVVIASDQSAIPVSGTITVTPSGTQNTNLIQIDGTAASVNNGTTDAGTLRVTLSSDSTGQVKLAAGANVIGHVVTDTGSTTAVTGNVTAVQATGTNLHVVVDSAPTTAVTGTFFQATQPVSIAGNQNVNVAQINGITPLMGNGVTGTGSQRVTLSSDNTAIAGWGQGATGAAVPSGAEYQGGLAQTALPAAATAGNLTGTLLDKFGRQVIVSGTIRDLRGTQTTTISASTSETTVVTAGASGIFNDLIAVVISNTSASTNSRVDFRDTTGGSVIFSVQCPGNQTAGFAIPGESIPQTTAATNWTAQCGTSTTDIRVFAFFEKNK